MRHGAAAVALLVLSADLSVAAGGPGVTASVCASAQCPHSRSPAKGVDYIDRIRIAQIAALFPKTAKRNVEANWPLVRAELKRLGFGSNREIVVYTLATVRVENSAFSTDPESPSKYSKSTDKPGYAGIQEPGVERPFGAYDSTIRFHSDGSPIVNKQLGNCLYRGKDEQLMRSRQGMPPLPECSDGVRYRGRGFIQLTGRDNYQRMQREIAGRLDVNLVDNPDDAARPDVAARILALYVSDNAVRIEETLRNQDYAAARKIVNKQGLGTEVFESFIRRFPWPDDLGSHPVTSTARHTRRVSLTGRVGSCASPRDS
jgi:hypothetical protein